MANTKLGFEDFISAVDTANKAFIEQLNDFFVQHSCKIDVKEAKSGYVVSYVYNKKNVVNFVFRKSGIFIRIYANHIKDYMGFLETLPENMLKDIKAASVCKRLMNPDDCNPKCAQGYDFLLFGENLKKCRNNAFMFLLKAENNQHIKAFVENELNACG